MGSREAIQLLEATIGDPAGLGVDWLMDTRLAKAAWLFPGLLCFTVASILGTFAHIVRLKDLKYKR